MLDFLDALNKLLAYVLVPKYQFFGHMLGVAGSVVDSIGYFGNLFSATLDLIEIGSKCGDDAIGAVLAYLVFSMIFWALAWAIGVVSFGMGLVFGLMFNAIMDFLMKPAILKECGAG